jgi:hypothetical protein
MSDEKPAPTKRDDPEVPRAEGEQPERSFALVGVIFVIVLALGAMYLVNRMRHWAAMGDCAFTHAPACRELIEN